MEIMRNFPCISIILCMCSAIISSALSGKWARRLNVTVVLAVITLSGGALVYSLSKGYETVYKMGRFPAPWGNEIRFGVLEAVMALFFSGILLLSVLGGSKKLKEDIDNFKENLYFVLLDLLLSSLLALIYTNDLFTAYVFVEICTIAACGLIMASEKGRAIEAATRYMIYAQIGSGLLLFGLCILYDITGHLLMSNIKSAVIILAASGQYHIPLVISIVFIGTGLAIKSALFPFHAWLPDSYGYSPVPSAAILSSLVSKGYIFLLLKIFYRVFGLNVIQESHLFNILLIFGLAGMIFGSVSAILEQDIRRMIAFSSVAQIGYIYMGFGMGIRSGMVAAVFHIISHAASKSLLFISSAGLTDASGKNKTFKDLTGAAYRNKIAGAAFTTGALSMVGVPLFSGFISKLLFAKAAFETNAMTMVATLVCLAISTILNAVYFLKTVARIYTPATTEYETIRFKDNIPFGVACILFIILNLILGLASDPLVEFINRGLMMFS